MATYVPAKINTAFECYVSLVSQANTKIVQVSPTMAIGDVKVSTDNGTASNIATLPVIGTDTRVLKVNLSAAEMNGGNVTVIFSDAAGAEWCDLVLNIQTAANQIDDLAAGISGIGTVGGSSISIDANGDNEAGDLTGLTAVATLSTTAVVGTFNGTTFTNTSALDGTYFEVIGGAGNADVAFQLLTGGGTTPVGVVWTGNLTNNSKTGLIRAWNHVGGAWETIGSVEGQNSSTTNIVKNLVLYSRHAGTSAAELGKVYIRLVADQTAATWNTDQLYVSYAVTSRSVGYAGGSIWIDTVLGVAGTEDFVNGVADHPVLTMADGMTIAASLGLKSFRVANGSTLTIAATMDNWVLQGHEWTLALNNQSIASSMFIDASVSGIGTGNAAEFEDCQINTVTVDPSQYYRCTFLSTFTVGATGDYLFMDCASQVPGTGAPVFDLAGLGATTISFRRWSGGMTLNNVAAGDVISIDVVSGGTITVNGSGGTVTVRGICNVVDGSGGSVTIVKTSVLNQTVLATPTNITAGTITTVSGNVDGTVNSVVDVSNIFTTQMTESYRANGAAPTLAQAQFEAIAHLGEAAISGTTKTIKKVDHSTTAETFTLDSATDPATITRAT